MAAANEAHEAKILGDALEAFARTTGLKAKKAAGEPKGKAGWRPDAEIVVENAGRHHRYIAEIKNADRLVILAQVKQQLDRYGQNGILITPYLTAELANYCREDLDLQFIDTAGNAYLRGPGLLVYVRGERPLAGTRHLRDWRTRDTIGARGGGTGTALRVLFAMLCRPELLNAKYRDIAAAVNVALGAVGWVFYDLEARGLTVGGPRKGNRRFADARRATEEWVTNYPVKLRPRLKIGTFRAANPEWWHIAQLQPHGAVWGGEVAGDRLTENREPGRFTLYMGDDANKFVIAHRLRADPQGDVEILRRFWNFDLPDPYPPDLAPPLLVHADLMATTDPRNHNTAQLVYDQFLARAFDKT
jgi:hypothetical protein